MTTQDALERIAVALEQIADALQARQKKTTHPGSQLELMHEKCMTLFQPGERIIYRADLGAIATFYRWRKRALACGHVVRTDGTYWRKQAASEGVRV